MFKYKIFLPVLVLILFYLVLTGKIFAAEEMRRKIIVFKPEVSNEEIKENLISRFGGRKLKDLKLPIIASDTRGNYGRTIEFDIASGVMLVKSAFNGNKEI